MTFVVRLVDDYYVSHSHALVDILFEKVIAELVLIVFGFAPINYPITLTIPII